MESIIKIKELCKRLGISRTTLYRNLPSYLADGLQEVKIKGGGRSFRESSVDSLIAEAARTGYVLGELRHHRRGRRTVASSNEMKIKIG